MLTPKQQELGELMSTLSEDMWSASWLNGNEFILWAIVQRSQKVENLADMLDDDQIDELRELADQAGGWFVFREMDEEPTFMPMAQWLKYYEEHGKRYA